jgi:hypothetical protein
MSRPDAEPIGGSIPYLNNVNLFRRFRTLKTDDAGKDHYLHMTLSLPAGIEASRKLWSKIVKSALKCLGINPEITPWFSKRHQDSNCDHVHTAIVLNDFTGRPIHVSASSRVSEDTHRHLCEMLGLPAPVYFDINARARLDPVTPKRRLSSPSNEELYNDLRTVFHETQPETLTAFNEALSKLPGGFQVNMVPNQNGILSFNFSNSKWSLFGGVLGTGYEPRFIQARLKFARTLRSLRHDLEIGQLVQIFKQPRMEKILAQFIDTTNPTRTAEGLTNHSQPIEEDGSKRPRLTSAHGSVGPSGGSKGVAGGDAGKSALELSGKTGAISNSVRGNDSPHSAYGKADRNISRDNEGPIFNHEPEVGQNLVSIEHPPRLTLGTLLARVCAVAAKRTSGWKLKAQRGHKSIAVVFVDLSAVVVTPHDATISTDGDEATFFRDDYIELIRGDKPEDERYDSDDGPQM